MGQDVDTDEDQDITGRGLVFIVIETGIHMEDGAISQDHTIGHRYTNY